MTSNFIRLFLAVYLCAFLTARLSAEEPIKIEFQAITWGPAMNDLFYRSGGKTIPIPVLPLKTGALPKFSYSGSPQIDFFRKGVSDSGVTSYVPAGSVKIEASQKRVLILFTPPIFGADPTKPISAIALPNDTEGFANGQLRLANCTPVSVAIKCNQQVVELPAGASKIISPGAPHVRLEMAAWSGTDWKVIASTFVSIPADSRLNAFVYLGGRLGEENPQPPAPGEPVTARDFSIITFGDIATP